MGSVPVILQASDGSPTRSGNLLPEVYPSSRQLNLAYGNANEPIWAGGTYTTTQNGVSSTANTVYMGWMNFSGFKETYRSYGYYGALVLNRVYNSREQVTSLYLKNWNHTDNSPDYTQFAFGYYYGSNNNNGNLLNSGYWNSPTTVAVAGGSLSPEISQSYSYDGVNRLTNVTDSSYSRTMCYDAYGNGWVTGATGSTGLPGNAPQEIGMACPASGATMPYTATNQLKSVGYDGAGNETSFRGNTLAYDAENRVSSVKSSSGAVLVSYQYDGDGKRITKTTPSGTTNSVTNYLYDAPGRLMAEYVNGVLSKEYMRMHSEFISPSTELVAIENAPGSGSPCSTCYVITDDLGNVREMADGLGNTIARHDYLPFGEEALPDANRPASVGFDLGDGATLRFTGKERDAESGLDYFGARYYGSALGRFTSPDPIWITKERLLDPQRLNLFIYGRNNPLSFVDPDGMDVTLGTCSTGTRQECFQQLEAGLKKEDRGHVHLVKGDGSNGFKKSEYGITVDAGYKSSSKNFQTLQALAGDHSATARIDILNSDDKLSVMVPMATNVKTGQETMGTMTMTPGQDGGFSGYTFYPNGAGVPGPYSTGAFTDVVVNASRGEVPETIQHELRHVLLGDFGRLAPYGAHGTGTVDRQTTEAEKEASKNKTSQ